MRDDLTSANFVSIHASAREATLSGPRARLTETVSIHASAREATLFLPCNDGHTCCFNPRLRTGGDGMSLFVLFGMNLFQSTPPHGRRLLTINLWSYSMKVSIHASAREATRQYRRARGRVQTVSIHASAREATPRATMDILYPSCVSIHASAREATNADQSRLADTHVSIHASAREATSGKAPKKRSMDCFNPRLRTGGDAMLRQSRGTVDVFQSTPPHGRRLEMREQVRRELPVSIHASAREATIGVGLLVP